MGFSPLVWCGVESNSAAAPVGRYTRNKKPGTVSRPGNKREVREYPL
jgi:hypothetical protein